MKKYLKNIILCALLLAIGLILPFFTGQIPQIGNMLLPMHIPVLLCGIICGWKYGFAIGAILPTFRFILFGMPPLYPIGIAMTFELATYGLVVGLIYRRFPKNITNIYCSLSIAMILGRIVWGVIRVLISGVSDNIFTWELFISGAVLNAIPGIILQLIFIPTLIIILNKTGVLQDESNGTQLTLSE